MMMGKRGRAPMKRTTSMTEFTLELNGGAVAQLYQPSDPHNPFNGDLNQHYMASAAAAPRLQRRNSADYVQTASFLRVCSFCNSRLIPGHDIFMQQQINQDKRKDKCSFTASKKEAATTGDKVTFSSRN
ncbi:FCS-Like Zinc finger 6-like [Salvia hispanica]|uniref:FCS-Like Zinc finger 6-like n=1 Tax=Salvia hispanica TaxID=49212 RepID=UPI00200925BB|nr:FCS-Like Zinc finger 6-like [Salvia hispanica]